MPDTPVQFNNPHQQGAGGTCDGTMAREISITADQNCATVLLETEWVLRGVYGFSAAQCAMALAGLAGLPHVTLEDTASAAKALGWMRGGRDYADGLHLATTEGCDAFISFDRNFAKAANALGGMKVRAP